MWNRVTREDSEIMKDVGVFQRGGRQITNSKIQFSLFFAYMAYAAVCE